MGNAEGLIVDEYRDFYQSAFFTVNGNVICAECEDASTVSRVWLGWQQNDLVEYRQMDLASRASIDRFVDEMKSKFNEINSWSTMREFLALPTSL